MKTPVTRGIIANSIDTAPDRLVDDRTGRAAKITTIRASKGLQFPVKRTPLIRGARRDTRENSLQCATTALLIEPNGEVS